MAWAVSATHVQRERPVALALLRFRATRETVARFFPPGREGARASNEAPGRVLDVVRAADGTPLLVMESLDGFELQKIIDEPGWLPVNTVVDFAIQACEGLAAIHGARIVRRDVRATLTTMRSRAGWILGKRIAFGIPKLAPASSFAGSEGPGMDALSRWPLYTAPERMPGAARENGSIDAPADIWSLGVLLYELLGGGCSPFEAATLAEVSSRILLDAPDALSVVRAGLPLGLETVVYRCLEKDPSRRYPDGQSLAIALAPYGSRNGQLRARRLQHSRPQSDGAQPFNARRSLPPMLSPPRPTAMPAGRELASVPPQLPGPTGTVRLLAAAPRAPARATTRMLTAGATRATVRMLAPNITASPPVKASAPLRDSLAALLQAQGTLGKRPFNVLVACIAVALSVLGVLVGTAVLAIRAERMPAPHAVGMAAGIPNHMPEEIAGATGATVSAVTVTTTAPATDSAATVTLAAPPIEVPLATAQTEHVFAPEELPLAAPSAHATPLHPSARTNRVGPDGF
jgi:hypothetical protein